MKTVSREAKTDLHNQIMNIQLTSQGIGKAVEEAMQLDNDIETKLAYAYKMGCRDVRHKASDLVITYKSEE